MLKRRIAGAACLAAVIHSLAAASAPLVKSVSVTGTAMAVTLETRVGRPYDIRAIEADLRQLWNTGRFDDIRVQRIDEPAGVAITFFARQKPSLRLHGIQVTPSRYGLTFDIPRGTPVSRLLAHQFALRARNTLIEKGYTGVAVDAALIPFAGSEVDLRLTLHASANPVRVRGVEFSGASRREEKQLRRMLPLDAPYNAAAVEASVARLRAHYVSKGYFDAAARIHAVDEPGGSTTLQVQIDPGPQSQVRRWTVAGLGLATKSAHPPPGGAPWDRDLCACLFAERRDAERQGILDFAVRLQVQPVEPGAAVDLALSIERGPAYRIGRIDFAGNRHYADAVIRGNLALDEGALFNPGLLRKSLRRINQTQLFEPLRFAGIVIRSNGRMGTVDLKLLLKERPRGSWLISGPLGPSNIFGPLQASVSSRLPDWGRGVFELSTYTVSLSLVAFASPVLPVLGVTANRAVFPIIALHRPFMPAAGWMSGFAIAPRAGWPLTAIGYATAQVRSRAIPLLQGDPVPPLAVALERPGSAGSLLCEPPRNRLSAVRRVGVVGLEILGGLTSF